VTAAFGRIGYSSVNIFTILRVSYLENRGFLPDKAGKLFFFYQSAIKGLSGLLPPLVTPQAHEDDQSHPSSVEIKISWSCTSLSQNNFM
jgi:hypothetical protein